MPAGRAYWPTMPYFESRSRMSSASYALEIHDTGWGAYGGEGARLAIRIALNDVTDLRDSLGYLHKYFGLSKNGIFFIHRSECCWHGVGAEEFLQAAIDWRQSALASPRSRADVHDNSLTCSAMAGARHNDNLAARCYCPNQDAGCRPDGEGDSIQSGLEIEKCANGAGCRSRPKEPLCSIIDGSVSEKDGQPAERGGATRP